MLKVTHHFVLGHPSRKQTVTCVMTDELKNYNGFNVFEEKKVAIKSVTGEIKPETMQNSTPPPLLA